MKSQSISSTTPTNRSYSYINCNGLLYDYMYGNKDVIFNEINLDKYEEF